MAILDLLQEGKLTEQGQKVGYAFYLLQCDRHLCAFCSRQNRATQGPGADTECPAFPFISTRAEVDQVLTTFMGKAPDLGAQNAVTESVLRRLSL